MTHNNAPEGIGDGDGDFLDPEIASTLKEAKFQLHLLYALQQNVRARQRQAYWIVGGTVSAALLTVGATFAINPPVAIYNILGSNVSSSVLILSLLLVIVGLGALIMTISQQLTAKSLILSAEITRLQQAIDDAQRQALQLSQQLAKLAVQGGQ